MPSCLAASTLDRLPADGDDRVEWGITKMQFAEKDRAVHYRQLAKLLRARADNMPDQQARDATLEAAATWEPLAKLEEDRGDKLRFLN